MPHSTIDCIRMAGNDAIVGIKEFIWIGGRIFKWSNKEPRLAFANGWTATGGHDDIVEHVTNGQGADSNFISCSLVRDATMDYGQYMYEIELTHPHTKAIDADAAVRAITHRVNPFFWQKEISVYKRILPLEVTAVWIKIPDNEIVRRPHNDMYPQLNMLLFEEEYKRTGREAWLRANPA